MDRKEIIALYNNITDDYDEECTQYYGYHHTKAKDGKNPLIELDEIEKLRKLL